VIADASGWINTCILAIAGVILICTTFDLAGGNVLALFLTIRSTSSLASAHGSAFESALASTGVSAVISEFALVFAATTFFTLELVLDFLAVTDSGGVSTEGVLVGVVRFFFSDATG